MKKILIFYGSYGGGHLSAAKSIESCFKTEYNNKIEIQTVDCIEYINKYINKVSTGAYKELAKKAPWAWKQVYKRSQNGALSHISNTTNRLMSHKLNSLIKNFNPDLIVSTPNDNMKSDMIAEGVDKDKIFVTGIPVSEKFSEDFNKSDIYKEFGLVEDKPTVLFFAGGEFGLGRNTTYMTLKALIRLFKNLQIVAISGRNQKMKKRFIELVDKTSSSNRVKIIEFTNKVPELMSISIGVITKPGGLTVTESLVSHLPILVINPIPGQEEENAEFLVNNKVAFWIKKSDNIARILKNISRHPEVLDQMVENAKYLAKPYATSNICNTLINRLDGFVPIKNKIIVSISIKHKNKALYIEEKNSNNIFNEKIHLYGVELEPNITPQALIIKKLKNSFNIEVTEKDLINKSFITKTFTYKNRQVQIINLIYELELDTVNIVNSTGIKIIWK